MPHARNLSTAVVRSAWAQFCATGDPGHLRALPADVAASWQRSRTQGVDPGLRCFPMSQSGQRWDEHERFLLRHVEPAVAPFRRELCDSRALLAVIGASGRIIFRDGNVSTLRAADTIGSMPGALALENVAGTNSAGTALYRHEVTWIHAWAHYCEAFWSWSDIGAPIVHPRTGALLGLIDIGLPAGTVSPALAVAAKAIAGNVEREILAQESVLNWHLLERWAMVDAGSSTAVLAVDRDGAIMYATEGARRLLGSAPEVDPARSLRAVPELEPIVSALSQRAGSTCTIELGRTRQRMVVDIEPAVERGEVVGAIVRLNAPRLRAATRSAAWTSRYSFDTLFGESPAFKSVVALARRVAPTDMPVLLHGETGTGKELIAHAIHAASTRAHGPFVTVNCGAIPPELIASELFGYEKGAFTGANRSGQRGKFEQADGGTLFLDEITETGAALQVSLLRVIQDKEVVPVGADKARGVDVRIISATNRNPAEVMDAGVLRRDLYYRLNGAILALPPLRERRDDIAPLAVRFCAESGRDISLAPATLDKLQAHTWPGNLRELRAVVVSAALLAEGDSVEPHDLPAALRDGTMPVEGASEGADVCDLKSAEIDAIEKALVATRGNVKEAAGRLGIGRSSLYRKLAKLALARTSSWK